MSVDLTEPFQDWLSLGKRIVEIENNILKEERAAFERLRAEVHFRAPTCSDLANGCNT